MTDQEKQKQDAELEAAKKSFSETWTSVTEGRTRFQVALTIVISIFIATAWILAVPTLVYFTYNLVVHTGLGLPKISFLVALIVVQVARFFSVLFRKQDAV